MDSPPNAASATKATPEKQTMEFPITYPMMIAGIPITAKTIRGMVNCIKNIRIRTTRASKAIIRTTLPIASTEDIPSTEEQIENKTINVYKHSPSISARLSSLTC